MERKTQFGLLQITCWTLVMTSAKACFEHVGQAGVPGPSFSVQYENIKNIESLETVQAYAVKNLLSVPSTSKLKFRVNAKAFTGHTPPGSVYYSPSQSPCSISKPSRLQLPSEEEVEAFLSERHGRLTPDMRKLVIETLTGKFKDKVTFNPSDEELNDTLTFITVLKQFAAKDSNIQIPEIESMYRACVPPEVIERYRNVTATEFGSNSRKGKSRRVIRPSPLHIDPHHLEVMLHSVLNITRHHSNQLDKMTATEYIARKLDSYGLMVVSHIFSSKEYEFTFGEALEGVNVIGILPGVFWGTQKDKPVVIGAHFDTVLNTVGLDDNGSGVAAMLESARVLSSSNCIFRHSVIFVAFDLEEIGTHGAAMFIKDYLIRILGKKFGVREIAGAYIMDCVANFDPTNGSQVLPDGWANNIEGLAEDMEKHNHSGNFAAVIYRKTFDRNLMNKFQRYYEGQVGPEYRLLPMGINDLDTEIFNQSAFLSHFDLLRSDHFRFWFNPDEEYNMALPAVLITDTGPFRGHMQRCYHSPCDNVMEGFTHVGLLSKVTQAVVWSAADLAGSLCGPRRRMTSGQIFDLVGKKTWEDQVDQESFNVLSSIMDILKFLGHSTPSRGPS